MKKLVRAHVDGHATTGNIVSAVEGSLKILSYIMFDKTLQIKCKKELKNCFHAKNDACDRGLRSIKMRHLLTGPNSVLATLA